MSVRFSYEIKRQPPAKRRSLRLERILRARRVIEMRFPGIIAVQRLRTWLLVTALVSVVLTAVLVADLARNLRTVVISEENKELTSAVRELSQYATAHTEGSKEGPTRTRLATDMHW